MGVKIADSSMAGDANLQLYVQLESNGTDSSSNGYNLTSPVPPSYVAGNLSDNCADFESSSSQYLTIANASCPNLEISGSQSWVCWINPETVTGYVGGKAQASTVGWIGIRVGATYVDFYAEGLTTNSYVRSNTTMSAGTWYHFAGIYDSANSKLKIYMNGVKTEVTASGSHSDSNGDFSIGRLGAWGGGKWDGLVNDFAIFDRVLTDSEVNELVGSAPSTAVQDVIGGGIIPFAR